MRACHSTQPPRTHPHGYDKQAYKARNLIEGMFCRLKDVRRIATRYDKRAAIDLSSVLLAATVTWGTNRARTLEPFSLRPLRRNRVGPCQPAPCTSEWVRLNRKRSRPVFVQVDPDRPGERAASRGEI